MITKLASSYFSGTDVFGEKSVKGFRSAILTIKAVSGETFSLGAYQTFDGTSPSAQSQRAFIYKDNIKQEGNITINTAGEYTYVIDFDGATNIFIAKSGTITNSVVSLNLKQDKYDNTYISSLKDIKTTEEEILLEAQSKGYDVFSNYSWNHTVDVHKYKSAKFIILGISTSVGVTATVNPDNTNPASLDKIAELHYGKMTINTLNPYINEVDIDVSEASILKFSGSGIGSQSLSLYLLLSEREIKLEDKNIKSNLSYFIGTKYINTCEIDFTIDGLADGQSNAGIRIVDENNNAVEYILEGVIISKDTTVTEAKTYHLTVDCRKINGISVSGYRTSGLTLNISSSDEITDYSKVDTSILSIPRTYIFDGMKQLEFSLEKHHNDLRVTLVGSNDNFKTTENISYINIEQNVVRSSANYNAPVGLSHYFANVEGYQKCKISITSVGVYNYDAPLSKIDIVPHKEYKSSLNLPFWGNANSTLIKGYRFAKILFKKSIIRNGIEEFTDVKDCSPQFIFNGLQSNLRYYDLGMNLLSDEIKKDAYVNMFPVYGNAVGGGVVVEFPEPISIATCPMMRADNTRTGYKADVKFEVEYYIDRPEPETYLEKLYEKEFYDVYRLPSDSANRDVLNKDILEWTDNTLYFWYGGYLGVKYEIPFGENNVKNYVAGEKINFAYLLPYGGNKNRSGQVGNLNHRSRIVVFTNSRIYHNFPQRATNTGSDTSTSDIQMFDESSIITLKKWQPVNDKTKADAKHKYLPVLSEYNYNQFDGRVAGTTGFVDTYNNGGLVTTLGRLWLDIPIDGVAYWNRLSYSNMVKGQKWCLFGNYNGAVPGTEPIAIATNDGGRTWYEKAYFACTDFYKNNYGSKINLKPITDVAAYVTESLRMCRRRFNVPTPENKEPEVPFIINNEEKSLVTSFTTDADGDVLVTLADNVAYDGKCPVVYFENVSANAEWDYICNTGFTADGTTVNSGIFFRVIKVTDNTYKLFADIGNQYEGDMVCRHIHAVNDIESGFLISTGESYCEDYFEGGFIYHLKQTNKNIGNVISPTEAGDVLRLCSSYKGVNRACGAYLFSDNADPTLLYVSDEAFEVGGAPIQTEKRYASIPGRTKKVPITPGGIYVGKLSDIDDQSKYTCVCESHSVFIGLLRSRNHYAALAGDGIMFSKDGFNWSMDTYIDNFNINGADDLGNIYFGNKIAIFK